MSDLVVVSWNIEHGLDAGGAASMLRDHPIARLADVVLLQEMDEAGVGVIAAALTGEYAYARASVHRATGRDFGNAVIARHPVTDSAVTGLPHRAAVRGEPRITISARVGVPQGAVIAVSTHTEVATMSLRRRRDQFATAAAAPSCACPIVVGGDFNTASRRSIGALDAAMGSMGFLRASSTDAVTFRRFGRGFTMDHLFTRGLDVVGTGVIGPAPASDHRPIWTSFSYRTDATRCRVHPPPR
ncbi:MAG: endonuclease/exonuclease/phosphatase family protein [Desertimonas sp.]